MRRTRCFDLMAPGSATRNAAGSVFRPDRVPIRRRGVIPFGVPIDTPLVYVVAHIEQSVAIRNPLGHAPRSLPRTGEVFDVVRRFVSPGEIVIVNAAAACLLPFGFGW